MNFKLIIPVIVICFSFWNCEPSIEEKAELGALPSPSFDITPSGEVNTFILTNTTSDAFLTNWEIQNSNDQTGSVAEVYYQNKGTYDVTMTTFNRGGSASLTKQIVVEEDHVGGCSGNFELLTNCEEKVWKLAAEPGALNIGMTLEETWWSNSDADVLERTCHFNDEYIFRENGEFEYVNNGDLWIDSDDNGNSWPSDIGLAVGCHNSEDLPDKYKSWDSGLHAFNIDDNNLTIIGEGAWIGLYKIGTNDEVTTPQSSITYSIASITADRMVIFADYGWGVWRITLTSE